MIIFWSVVSWQCYRETAWRNNVLSMSHSKIYIFPPLNWSRDWKVPHLAWFVNHFILILINFWGKKCFLLPSINLKKGKTLTDSPQSYMVPWSFLEVPLWKLRGDGSLKCWSGLHSPGPSPSKAFCSGVERVQFLGLPQPSCMVAWMKELEWGGAKWAGSQVSMQSRTTNGSLTWERKNVSSGRGGGGGLCKAVMCVQLCVISRCWGRFVCVSQQHPH